MSNVLEQKWRTIESAPKDGTEVDLWCHNKLSITTGLGRATDCHFYRGEWIRWTGCDENDGYVTVYNATHWMPIPDGPA